MRIKVLAISSCLVILAALCIFAGSAYAPTKIAPTEGEPGHPFTIIDTPEGRLVDGCVAVFELYGDEIVISLRTHKPHKTAQGRLPEDIGGGEYSVFVRCGNTEIEIGTFTVIGDPTPPQPPSISPTCGYVNVAFTITDPQGRIEQGDLAVFYVEGTDPTAGSIADNIVISNDGTTLTGEVPGDLSSGSHFVSVRPTLSADSRFNDLAFEVDGSSCDPYVLPTSNCSGNPFTITDPQGRIEQGDLAVFYYEGTDPATGSIAGDIVISGDGTTLTGTVPALDSGPHFISVRPTVDSDSRFGDLAFLVTGECPEPSISPTSGPVTTPFTITDPLGRMAGATILVFFQEGDSPSEGTIVTDAVFSLDGTTVTGTVPTTLNPVPHFVSVHIASTDDPPVFNPISFNVEA
jgi:hypothetical protein